MNKIQHQLVLENDAVNRLSLMAEIFLHRLINVADRYGCFDARPMMLRARLFTLKLDDVTNDNMTAWLTECVDAGLIKLYEVNGMPYLQLAGFKRRLGSYKTPYPEPPFEYEESVVAEAPAAQVTEPVQTPLHEQVIEETPVPVYTPPLPAEESKPLPGREHEYFLNELFKPENEKVFYTLAVRIKQPELKPEWIKAFNLHIRDEGNHYATEAKWLACLNVWLPLNIERLIKEEVRNGKKVMKRAMVF